MYRQLGKNVLNNNTSSTCSADNMVNFGPLTVGHPCKFQRISCLGSVTCTASSSGRQLNFAALNRGRHVCSAGRPSRWALAHILVFILCYFVHDFYAVSHQILVTQMTALHNFFDFKNYKKIESVPIPNLTFARVEPFRPRQCLRRIG